MNRAIRRIPLQHQAAAPLRIVRIVLDHDGRRNPGDDVANLYIVRGQLLGSVERDSYFVACHQRLDAVEGVGHERCRDQPRRILLHETTRDKCPPRMAYNRLPIITINMNDWPARTDPKEAAIGRPTQTARRLVEASVSPNTRRAYAGALRRLDVWLYGRELDDVALAAYLAELHDAGRASSSASMAVAAACFRAKLAGQAAPAGERTARVLAGYRRTAGDRGRGQARPFGVSDLAAVLATCHRPRRRGRGLESEEVARERGCLDAVIAGLLFMAGMRRSEVSALRWADVVESTDADGMLVTVRRSKTNQEGETNDVRFVKDGVARVLRTLRGATSPEPGERVVPLSAQMIGLRFTTAALAAGVESRVTAHSGRVGLASELTSRGASTTDVMLAGNWKTSRMVAHYSAGATAERGAVARYL